MKIRFVILFALLLTQNFAIASDSEKVWPLRFGVDDAGGPHPLHKYPQAEKLFKELGFNLWVMHFMPKGVNHSQYIQGVDNWCGENDVEWVANLESANWIASYRDELGRDWYQQADGRHFFRFPDDVLGELAGTKHLLGVMFDEAAHMQNTCNPTFAERVGIAGLGHPFMYNPENDALEQAADHFYQAVNTEGQRYRDKKLRLFTEHVFPVLFHPFAKAGYTAAPKILKESWSPVAIACAMGAALQYDTELWITPDLWGMSGYPSHSPEAYRSALLLAYHLGADCIYTENLAYDYKKKGYGSLVYFTEDGYRVTPHGEVTKWFIHDHVPANPRHYSFREIQPRVAIIRQPDTCWGQDISWLPDTLFGHPDWHSTPTTKAWFAVWHLLTRDVVPAEGLTWHCNVMEGKPQQVFAPLDGVVVFDHLVEKRHIENVEALFLTGIGISPDTLDAVAECVRSGATCFTLASLAPENVHSKTGDNGIFADGEGRWVVTTDFLADFVREAMAFLLPEPDAVRYQFGNTEVVLKMEANDPNRITAGIN